ncbi:hypothetical protein RHSIM_Rhsim06G0060500 [Rhododendron simsii]|uniref:Uncharacterized protein n=1 Tax=Rhododendron simsii TaxID=118357 RepID=A0A834LMN7_RHOSS|nr:hypothetical protein RHSIM_Rhsim06G0060500 [Rhododendron simsii]
MTFTWRRNVRMTFTHHVRHVLTRLNLRMGIRFCDVHGKGGIVSSMSDNCYFYDAADKVPFQGRMAFGLFERDGGSEGPSHTANSGGYYGFCKDEVKSDGKREKRKKSELPDEFVRAQKIRAKLFGVNPRWSFTLEEFTEYNEKINMNGGFDIGNAPLDIDFHLMYLRPVQLSPGGLWTLYKVKDISKLALDKYNEDLQKKYEFVKFLKANYSSSIQALELYLTFEAKDTNKDVPVKTFQAHISRLFGGNAEVKFCRTA